MELRSQGLLGSASRGGRLARFALERTLSTKSAASPRTPRSRSSPSAPGTPNATTPSFSPGQDSPGFGARGSPGRDSPSSGSGFEGDTTSWRTIEALVAALKMGLPQADGGAAGDLVSATASGLAASLSFMLCHRLFSEGDLRRDSRLERQQTAFPLLADVHASCRNLGLVDTARLASGGRLELETGLRLHTMTALLLIVHKLVNSEPQDEGAAEGGEEALEGHAAVLRQVLPPSQSCASLATLRPPTRR